MEFAPTLDVPVFAIWTKVPLLLDRVEANDPDAWQRFVQLYAPLIYGWCRNAGLQPADVFDVAQNVIQAVATDIQSFEPGRKSSGAFRSWLWGVTRFRLLSYFRQRDKQVNAIGGEDAQQLLANLERQTQEPESVGGATSEQILKHSALEMLKSELDPRTWKAFWRMAVDGVAAKDVGEELQMNSKAVRQAKFRVTKKLRELLPDVVQFL